jgi:hypothetical protein
VAETTIEERRAKLFEELDDLVQRMAALETEEQNHDYFPAGHVLVVAYDNLDPEDNSMVGSCAVYPANGSQAGWKSRGMMHEAIDLYSRVHLGE